MSGVQPPIIRSPILFLKMNKFIENFLNLIKTKYVKFDGRASRFEYWGFVLVNFVIAVVFSLLDSVIGTGGLLYGVAGLALLLPGVSAAVRRLHDIGKSGWWLLISLIPIVGLVLLYFLVQPSQSGSNAYGEAPN
jgi:uncharacterized membrane protein YhaH (DUF805 family)